MLTDRQRERMIDAAHTALNQTAGPDNQLALLRALNRPALVGVADLLYVEHEGRRPESVITAIVAELNVTS